MTTEIISLVIGLVGLITAGIAAYYAIVNFIKSLKDKKAEELWALVMTMADAAMKKAEASQIGGAEKKQLVIDTVAAGLSAAGLDISDFLTQLSSYIDETITFVNEMQKAKENN
jgi:hypothetical protein